MLDEHALHYAHFQRNKETTVWTCAFSLCKCLMGCSLGDVGEEPVTWMKRRRKGCRTSRASYANPSVAALTSQLILQSFRRRFAYVMGTSPMSPGEPPMMSPTLQMTASIRNNSVVSFWEDFVLWRMFGFHLIPPYKRTFLYIFLSCISIYNLLSD